MTRASGGGWDGRYGDGAGTVDRCERPEDPSEDWSAGGLEEFLAVQEDLARRTLVAADFPVFGVAPAPPSGSGGPAPVGAAPVGGAPAGGTPVGGALVGYGTGGGSALDGAPGWVEVGSGDWAAPAGPYVTVRTHRPGADRYEPLPELEDVVEDERDRVYEQLGVDEGDAPGRVRALREWITVDGEPYPIEVHEDRRGLWSGAALPGCCPIGGAEPVWAGRFRIGGLTVTVCGRGVSPGGVELARIGDHERYLRGRTALLRELATRRGRHLPVERRELAPAVGLEAHRAVITHGIGEAAAVEARVRAGRPPRPPRGARAEAGAVRWEAAVRQQMRLATETREEAREAVTALVEQLSRLSQLTHWVVGTPEGEAAVEESIRYAVFASEVASVPAQRAWQQVRRGRTAGRADAGGAAVAGADGGGPGAGVAGPGVTGRPVGQGEGEEHRICEQLWLAAWEQWRAARAGR
ncbi:hypothetical protein [Kitasatospora sp. NPDC093806]|uniref:hypothetical protein n=1 Tax=Kitasatospora sp. NPDC093806 TaxID=3155075 RepID=UPI00341D9A74